MVIANVAPSVADVAMSLNTLRYVTPLKIGQSNREKMEPNMKNPANWTNEMLRNWSLKKSSNKIDVETFCPFESGMQILRIPEAEFVDKVLRACPSWSDKQALAFYKTLWGLLIDARTKDRKEKLKVKGKSFKERRAEQDRDHWERLERRAKEENGEETTRIYTKENIF